MASADALQWAFDVPAQLKAGDVVRGPYAEAAGSPTVAGLVITPLSLSMVLGAMLASPIIGALKRYQLVIVPGALLMGTGSFLLTLIPRWDEAESQLSMEFLLGVSDTVSKMTSSAGN